MTGLFAPDAGAVGATVMLSRGVRTGGSGPDRTRDSEQDQQRRGDAHCGDYAAGQQAVRRRAPQGGGESERVLDGIGGEHRQACTKGEGGEPGPEAERVPSGDGGEHEHRPVPEVPGVPAQLPQGPHGQDGAHFTTGLGTSGGDDQRRAEHREQRGDPRIGSRGAEPQAAEEDQLPTCPTGKGGQHRGQPAPYRHAQRHQATHRHLPVPRG
ncbi:MAG: hypothetical protein JO115_15915 [Pseudonocardiales bacterium]|nr:hypothetical protein [Pseudonocardiales bacterium]